MKRVAVVVLAIGMVVSACAANEGGIVNDTAGVGGGVARSEGPQDTGGTDDSGSGDSELPTDPGSDGDREATTSGIGEPGDPPPPADDSDSMVLGDEVPAAVTFALNDLATRLGISADLIDWVSHEEVDWPDGSVGCPYPDMAYPQVITNGTLTVFAVDGIEYRYHARAGMDPFYCDPARTDKAAKGSPGQIDLGDLIVTPLPSTEDDRSKPTESIPPPGGSDE